MNVGILSMQEVINYGSVLQAYSLKELVYNECGIHCSFIPIDTTDSLRMKTIPFTGEDDYCSYQVSYKLLPRYIVNKIINKGKDKIVTTHIRNFQNEILHLANGRSDEYDIVIVGSDEVFKTEDLCYLQLYGQIDNAKKIISYAACCGNASVCYFFEDSIKILEMLLDNFSAMSVRDSYTYNYVRQLYSREICMHLYPVLVGPLRKITRKKVYFSKYILVYAYSERIRNKKEIEVIIKFARKNRCKLICVGGKQYWCDIFLPIAPMELLDYFYNAEYVITDTFHGAIFAIITRKKFIVLKRKSNFNKITGMLNILCLSERLIDNIEHLERFIHLDIDYDLVFGILDYEEKRTRDYLRENIGGKENE